MPGIRTFLRENGSWERRVNPGDHARVREGKLTVCDSPLGQRGGRPDFSGTPTGTPRQGCLGGPGHPCRKGTNSMKRHATAPLRRHRTEQGDASGTKYRAVPFVRSASVGLGTEDGYDWLFRIARHRAISTVGPTGRRTFPAGSCRAMGRGRVLVCRTRSEISGNRTGRVQDEHALAADNVRIYIILHNIHYAKL